MRRLWQQGRLADASDFFDKMGRRNHIHWNIMISGFAKAKDQNFYLGLTWEWVRNGKE